MKTLSTLRRLAVCLTLALTAMAMADAGAQAKKQVKISHATAADVANDNHMVAFIIASYINSNSDTLEARIYPANQLGEERAVVEACNSAQARPSTSAAPRSTTTSTSAWACWTYRSCGTTTTTTTT